MRMSTSSPPAPTAVEVPAAGDAGVPGPAAGPSDPEAVGLAELVRPVRGRLLLGMALQVPATIAALIPYACVAALGQALLATGGIDSDAAWAAVILAIVALLVRFALTGIATTITHFADNDLTLGLRRRIVGQLGRVPLGWLDRHSSGRVRHAVQDDVAALHTLVAHTSNDIVSAAVAPVAILIYLVAADWRLTLLTLIPVAVFVLIYALVMRDAKDMGARYAAAQARVDAAAVEFVNGIAVVKAFGGSRKAHARFAREVDGFATAFASWVQPVMKGFAVAGVVISGPSMLLMVAAGGAWFVAEGWIAPVEVLPFAVLGVGLTAHFSALQSSGYALQSAGLAARRIGELLAVPALPVPVSPARPDGNRVEFHRVSAAYGQRRVLHDVDLVLAPGTVTAVVGPSGAGKSTLAGLLPRFADPIAGSIRLGGVDLREIDPVELYRHIGFVFQKVDLLRASVHDNIALPRPDADAGRVLAAATAAAIDDRIRALPRGYDSVIGDDARLSGGEAQRVSIARGLLADAGVLVLDEATAHADPESESQVQQALSELAAGRTVLVVAHRLATVEHADQIVVLIDGRVVEHGRHQDLMAAGGWYARSWAAERRADAMGRQVAL